MAGKARSEAGRVAVRTLTPVTDRGVVTRRLDALDELLALIDEAGAPPTTDVPLLDASLSAAAPEGAALEPRRLAEVRDLLAVARHVRTYLRRDAGRFPELAARANAIPSLPELDAALAHALDERGQIRDDATPALAAARAATRELRAEVEARLLRLVRDPALIDVVGEQYVTIRNGRFVVPIRAGATGHFEGVVQDRSGSDETLFIEPLFAVELNNRLLLAAKAEEIEEQRVRAELTTLVRSAAMELGTAERALADIDALGAAAAVTTQLGGTRPELGAADVALHAARHPLLALAGRETVPVDLIVHAGQRGLAITGPNAGGKTVALKTLGLAALMAQAGLFIPAAAGSRLPLFDAVLADIGDDQSIERDLSTFTGHAENLAAIAASAGPGALVLLDEPGAGTDPVEGAALAVGVLTDLFERGPRIGFSTHLPQVKTYALAEPTLEVAAFGLDSRTGGPTFHLEYHTVGQSLALPIARRHGIPQRAIAVAEGILAGESRDLAAAMARLERSRRHYEEGRADAEAERARLAAERLEAERLRADLQVRQRRRWSEDLEDSRRFLRDLESRGRAVLDELRRRPEPAALARFVREATDAIAAAQAAAEPTPSPSRPPVVGDTVEVAGRGIRGELVEIHGARARIQRGGLKFEVATDQLRFLGGPAPRERVAVTVDAPADGAEQIDLTGQRARDAIETLERFLDRAVRTGVSEVRVIHGIGTGALRRAVHELLASSPYCASFREADASAGGAGVTVAKLA